MILLKNAEFYFEDRTIDWKKNQLEILDEQLKESSKVFMTVEEKNMNKLEIISFPISDIVYKGMNNIEFYQDMEQVFVYQGQKNICFYLSLVQAEYYELLTQNHTRYAYGDIEDFVNESYKDYYGKAQHWLGTVDDIDNTASALYMDKISRARLHEAVLLKKMDNFKKKYGYNNQLLERQLSELKQYGV